MACVDEFHQGRVRSVWMSEEKKLFIWWKSGARETDNETRLVVTASVEAHTGCGHMTYQPSQVQAPAEGGNCGQKGRVHNMHIQSFTTV